MMTHGLVQLVQCFLRLDLAYSAEKAGEGVLWHNMHSKDVDRNYNIRTPVSYAKQC
jgi:hypothetical protein